MNDWSRLAENIGLEALCGARSVLHPNYHAYLITFIYLYGYISRVDCGITTECKLDSPRYSYVYQFKMLLDLNHIARQSREREAELFLTQIIFSLWPDSSRNVTIQ